jgi:ABC-type branched-subunit amino acid transport system substrate-binding protein
MSLTLSACGSTSRDEAREATSERGPAASEAAEDAARGESRGRRGSGPNGSAGDSDPSGGTVGDAQRVSTARGGKIRIGVHVSQNANAANQFGVARLPVTGPGEIAAIVGWINAHGGIGGRRVEHFVHVTDPLDGTFDAQAQAACEDLAQDKKVFAVVSRSLTPSNVLPACLAQHKVPLVWELHKVLTRGTTAKYRPFLYRPSLADGDRLAFIVEGLARSGFYGRSARVAIVRYDTAEHEFVSKRIFRPALKKIGVSVVDEAAVSEARGASDAGSVSAQSSNAVLRFQSSGVTHVLFVPTGAALPLLFMAAAEGQGFRPAYGLSTLDPPGFLAANHGASQLAKAAVVGWQPAIDTEAQYDPRPNTGASKLCHDIIRGAGFDGAQARFAEPYCDGLFFLKRALERTGRISADALRIGVESIRGSFDSPWAFGSRFGPGRYDGTAEVRNMKYNAACSCFNYAGEPYDVR